MLICDLDNTLSPHFSRFPTRRVIQFCEDVKKLGIIFVIVSNNSKKRVTTYVSKLHPDDYIYNAKKPLLRKIKKIMLKYEVDKDEVVIMGDQFITDV